MPKLINHLSFQANKKAHKLGENAACMKKRASGFYQIYRGTLGKPLNVANCGVQYAS